MSDEWTIQAPVEEGAAFLLRNGVMVGRLYGGAPIDDMLIRLNAPALEGVLQDTDPERMWATTYERVAWQHDTGRHEGSEHPYQYCPRCEMEHPDGKYQVALCVIRYLHEGIDPKVMSQAAQAILEDALAQGT